MVRTRMLVGGTAALVAAAAVTACSDTKDVVRVTPVNPLFSSYVALGNSITAGFQSGGINDSTQHESYAFLLAQQMGTRFAIPALTNPGCPPPLDNLLTQTRVGGGTSTDCALRDPSSVTPFLNNVAVPGATSFDPTSTSTTASNALTTLILGGKTQVQRALDASPTFVSVWIGNNDALAPALSGFLTPVAGISPGLTDTTTFFKNYDGMLNQLVAGGTIKGGVLIGVVDVTNAPILFSGALLNDPTVKGAFDQVAGTTTTLDPSCSPTTTALINFQMAAAIRAGTYPPTVACQPLDATANPVGKLFVLDPTERATVSQTVAEYNAHIQAKAQSLGWAYLDPNAALVALRSAGQIPPFPNLLDPANPFGAYISVDGVHPRKAAHVLVANALIAAINAQYSTNIPAIAP
jgi:lysophospholipase L1-like esterase